MYSIRYKFKENILYLVYNIIIHTFLVEHKFRNFIDKTNIFRCIGKLDFNKLSM